MLVRLMSYPYGYGKRHERPGGGHRGGRCRHHPPRQPHVLTQPLLCAMGRRVPRREPGQLPRHHHGGLLAYRRRRGPGAAHPRDVVLVPSGAAHELADTPGRPGRPMPEIAGRTLDDGAPPSDVVIEGDGPATVWICGGYRLAAGVRHPLTSVLPDVVAIPAAEARGTGLGAAVDLIAAEAGGTDPGAPAVMASLVDLLLVYLLRTWFAGHHDNAWGRALSDPTV